MHTRSVTMGWPKAGYRGNKTSELDDTLVMSTMQEASVNTRRYKHKIDGAMSPTARKYIACQRKSWSTAECKELRKWREEGQSFSDLSTVRALLYFSVATTKFYFSLTSV